MLKSIIPGITEAEEAVYVALKNTEAPEGNASFGKYLVLFSLLALIAVGSASRDNAPLLIFASLVLFGMQLRALIFESPKRFRTTIKSLITKIDAALQESDLTNRSKGAK